MKSPTGPTILECAFHYTNIFIEKKEEGKMGRRKEGSEGERRKGRREDRRTD